MITTSGSPAGDFWAITSYFNSARYRRRLSNYKIFRKYLKVPLVAVELSYSDDFELQDGDADILIRLRGGAVLWQKERLLNLALKALPESCRKVAWPDCDIIFRSDNWAESTSTLLERFPVVQPFSTASYGSASWDPAKPDMEREFSRPSAAYLVSTGVPAAECVGRIRSRQAGSGAQGLAWAARRELLDRFGFYDACILGGGNRAMNCGAYDCFEDFMDSQLMNEYQRRRYLAWAEPFRDSVRSEISYADGEVLHLWHGDARDRASGGRHEGMRRFGFDPSKDIAIQDNGCWGWSSEKPDMHEYVRSYFHSRREDG